MNQHNLKRIAIQYLRGLRNAGITDLSANAPQFPGTLIMQDSMAQQATIPEKSEDSVVDSVKESAPAFQNDGKQAGNTGDQKPIWAIASEPIARESIVGPGTADSNDYGPGLPQADRIDALKVLSNEVSRCTKCDALSKCRAQTVFGVGAPQPRLAFFGEAPGANEDRQGEPFVGRAGELLDKIIVACKMTREQVYILNAVKCRPPANRNPNDDEIQNCREFFRAQFEILQPEFICCLGSVAARTLLNTKESVGRLRGKFHQYRGSKVLVTYHPAYLLRTPAAKTKTWEDMQMLMAEMGIELD